MIKWSQFRNGSTASACGRFRVERDEHLGYRAFRTDTGQTLIGGFASGAHTHLKDARETCERVSRNMGALRALVERVIPARSWVNLVTGATASLYGACPWTSEADRANWELRTMGYTWELSNGTIGLGRKPAATEAEAIEVMERINSRAKNG